MANANYRKGVRFERERQKHYESLNRTCFRTAGSHGVFDLVVIDSDHSIVTLIQCKVSNDLATVKRLLRDFKENPPFPPMKGIHQTMEAKVTGSTEIHSITV